MNEFETLLTESVKNCITGTKKSISLQFSGGCDSVALFFGLINLKAKFDCHIYFLDENNRDLKAARALCSHYKKELCEYKLTLPKVIWNINLLKKKYNFKGKVNLQCMAGYYEISQKLENKLILNGSFVDICWGSTKAVYMNGGTTDKEVFDFNRKKRFFRTNYTAVYLEYINKIQNNETVFPFNNLEIFNFFLKFNFTQLNRPRMKGLFYETFQDRIPEGVKVERRSQQIASGVREALKGKKVRYK